MGYTIIDGKREIEEAQKKLINIIERSHGETFSVCKINDITEHSVTWFKNLEFWIDTAILDKLKNGKKENYFWNACGIMRRKNIHHLDITVQIGLEAPYNPRRAGVFIEDEFGKEYLAHTGKVNGKRNKGTSQELTIQKYILEHINKQTDFKKICIYKKELILIGCLDSDVFIKELSNFTHAIDRLKKEYNKI